MTFSEYEARERLKKEVRKLYPHNSREYFEYVCEKFPAEVNARLQRHPTDAEITRAWNAVNDANMFKTYDGVSYRPWTHATVWCYKDGTTNPPRSDYKPKVVPTRLNRRESLDLATKSNGFSYELQENGLPEFKVYNPEDFGVDPTVNSPASVNEEDAKQPLSAQAKEALQSLDAGARDPETIKRANEFQKISGQKPQVSWDGKMFAAKTNGGRTVFYRSVTNEEINRILPPNTPRITLAMQEEEARKKKEAAAKEAWDNTPVFRKLATIFQQTCGPKPLTDIEMLRRPYEIDCLGLRIERARERIGYNASQTKDLFSRSSSLAKENMGSFLKDSWKSATEAFAKAFRGASLRRR